MIKKVMTLVHVYDSERILLGLKKRGFGADLWNGFGGKVEQGEDILAAASRELEEEAGIKPIKLENMGRALFYFEEKELELHYFHASGFEGEIKESEEMQPQWFRRTEIPFDKMWPADKLYLPQLLSGKKIYAKFWLNNDKTVSKYEFL